MSSSNTSSDLRDILFETIRGVKDGSVKIDQAKAISDGAQTIINLAKAEIDAIKVVGAKRLAPSGFLGTPLEDEAGTKQRALEHAPRPTRGNGLPPAGPRGKL